MSEHPCDRTLRSIAELDDASAVLRHTATCPSCALELASQQFARRALRFDRQPVDLPAGLRARLVELAPEAPSTAPGGTSRSGA